MCNSKDNLCNVSFCFFHFIKITSAPLFIGSPTYFCGRRSLHTSFCAPYTATEKEFKASCIEKGKVLFYPGSDLRKLCKTLDFALYKSDGKPDSGDEPLPDDGKGDQPGGGSGDDGDEAPDPTV